MKHYLRGCLLLLLSFIMILKFIFKSAKGMDPSMYPALMSEPRGIRRGGGHVLVFEPTECTVVLGEAGLPATSGPQRRDLPSPPENVTQGRDEQ